MSNVKTPLTLWVLVSVRHGFSYKVARLAVCACGLSGANVARVLHIWLIPLSNHLDEAVLLKSCPCRFVRCDLLWLCALIFSAKLSLCC